MYILFSFTVLIYRDQSNMPIEKFLRKRIDYIFLLYLSQNIEYKAYRTQGSTMKPALFTFMCHLVERARVSPQTLMASLVYIIRLKSKVSLLVYRLPCTAHRIFLASLILADKYLNDDCLTNMDWARYTTITTDQYTFSFTQQQIDSMERHLLSLLEWNLAIKQYEFYHEVATFLAISGG